ncbi:MAG: winged helix DNA-binding protein [Planctomycetia bacterium]|nr:winged helix DNA-binding protein [Planctomycetia bacterium]
MKKSSAIRHTLPAAKPPSEAPWTFLTNHAHVLWCIYRDPEVRLRDVAQLVGITERMVQRIVMELAVAGYLTIEKQGRRNRYRLCVDRPLRHSLESHCQVGELLSLMARTSSKQAAVNSARPSNNAGRH